MEKFRDLKHREEFFQMVTKAPLIEIGEIWQSLPHKREVYRISHLELLRDFMIFQAKLPFDFDPNFPLFIKINYRELVFKVTPEEFRAHGNQMSCSYPVEAKAAEGRKLERTMLPKKSNLNITLRSAGRDFKVSLENISESGIGIRTSMANMEFFQRSYIFVIAKLCGQPIQETAVLSVRHTSLKTSDDFISVGLAADVTLSDHFFDVIREQIRKNRFSTEIEEITSWSSFPKTR